MHGWRVKNVLSSEAPPRRVRHLLLDEGHEVELRIKFVGFRPGVREETLLIQLLRYLWKDSFRWYPLPKCPGTHIEDLLRRKFK